MKYLNIVSGIITQLQALVSSSGAGDAYKIVATGSDGKLDSTVMPTGIGADTLSIVTSENLASGDLVNIWNNGGTANARKADATAAGKEVHGFVLAATTSGQSATVYFEGSITGLSGMTPGAPQYLATVAGTRTGTAPSTSGNVVQKVGTAITATILSFEPSDPVTLV